MKNEFAKIAKHQQSQLERVLAVKDALAQRNMELSRALRKKEHAQIQTLQKQIKLDEKIKLQNQKKGKGGEVHITDSIKRLINDGEKFIGHTFKGKYLDCGTMDGYLKSSMEISKI